MRILVVALLFVCPAFFAVNGFTPDNIKLPTGALSKPVEKNLEYYIRSDKTVRQYTRELFAAIDYYNKGKIREALKAFEAIDKKEPNNSGTLLWVSLCQRKLEQTAKSSETLKHAAASTDNSSILLLIGTEYLERKDYLAALKIGERVKKIKPNAKDGYYLIFPYYLQQGRNNKLEELIKEVEPFIPGDASLTLIYAAYMTQGKPVRSKEIENTRKYAAYLSKDDSDAWIKSYILALSALFESILAGDKLIPLEFASLAQVSLKMKPDLNGLRQPIIHSYYPRKMYAEAAAACDEFQKNERYESAPGDFETDSYFFCARSLISLRRNKDALLFIDRFHDKARFTVNHFGQLQQDIVASNDIESSYQLVSKLYVIKNLPHQKKIYEPLVTFSLLTNRPKEALNWSYKAEEDNYTNRVIFWGRFRALQELGKTKEALQVYEQHPELLSVLAPDPTPHVIAVYNKTRHWSSCIEVTAAYLAQNIDAKTRREAEFVLNECKKNQERK